MFREFFKGLGKAEVFAYSAIVLLFVLQFYSDSSTPVGQKSYFLLLFLLVLISCVSVISRINVLELEQFKRK
ncbi:MAG: hypothetical protein WC792_03680 [Candidatus Micrarchaeia archaeon]